MTVSENDIINYIEFLIQKQGLYISLHGNLSKFSALTRFNFHQHPCCLYVKTVCSCWDNCIIRQNKVVEHCKNGEFFGICYAGIGEFVYPMKCDGGIFGFISVSGYKGNKNITEIKQLKFSNKYGIDYKKLNEETQKLMVVPSKKDIDTLIRPLVVLCEIFYEKNIKTHLKSLGTFAQIIQYINEYHTANITMKDISKKFNYSVSTLSHIFKKQTGMSLSKYVENLRIEDAKYLLKQSNLQIVDIAMLLGFCNSGYFSSVFKKNTGVTPKQYASGNFVE